MAREIESMHAYTHKPHKYALARDRVVLRADDGAVYEFEQPDGSPRARLLARFSPDGSRSQSRAQLPASVKWVASLAFGVEGWEK